MKLCFISTTNSTKEISSLGDMDFCLLPYVEKSKEYKEYFINSIKKKRYVVADNLIAEGKPVSDDKLVALAIEMKVSELIIPDTIGDYQKTKKQREEFLNKYYNVLRKNKIKLQSVIQGKSVAEYTRCLYEILQDKRINVIGIPFRMDYKDGVLDFFPLTKEIRCSLKRKMYVDFLKKYDIKKEIHLLGCNLPVEMLIHLKDKKIRSMDTKLISRHALHNQEISFDSVSKPGKLFLEDKMTDKQIKLAKLNIKTINDGR